MQKVRLPDDRRQQLERTAGRFANGLLAVVTGYALSIDFVVWRDFDRYAVGWLSIGVFLILPLLVTALFVGAFRLPATLRLKFGVLGISVSGALFVGEQAVSQRPTLPDRLYQRRVAVARAQQIPFDARSKRQVVEDLRRSGLDAMPTVHPSEYLLRGTRIRVGGRRIVPLGGISSTLTVYCNESGVYTIYDSDAHGFHNPLDSYRSGQLDVAIVGDSYAHGAGVDSDHSVAAQVRRIYPRTLNLGYGGNGPLCNLAALREYAQPAHPQVVLWFHYEGNDLENLEIEWHSYLRRYLEPGFTLSLGQHQAEIDRQLRDRVADELRTDWAAIWMRPFRDALWLPRLRQSLLGRTRRWDFSSRRLEALARVMAAAQASVKLSGGELYLVYLPAFERYSGHSTQEFQRDGVLEILRARQIPVIDLVPDFAQHPDVFSLFPLRIAGHYNEDGYWVVAQAVLRRLAAAGERLESRSSPE